MQTANIITDIDEIRMGIPSELRPYLVEKGPFGGPWINSPLIQETIIWNLDHLNKAYAHKREYADRALAEKNWGRYIFIHERPYRIDAFEDCVAAGMGDDDARGLLGDVWIDTEHPSQHPMSRWIVLFRRYGPLGPRVEIPMTVYRGVSNPKDRRGLSWTGDVDRAKWFAKRLARLNDSPTVYRIVVTPGMVLARFPNDRGEDEYVVDPGMIRSFRIVR